MAKLQLPHATQDWNTKTINRDKERQRDIVFF